MNEYLPLLAVLAGVFVAWKVLKGVIKLAVIVALLAVAAYVVLGSGV